MPEFEIPESVAALRPLFEAVVSWGDRALADDEDARQRLVQAGYGLGVRRAEALDREMRAIDVEYALAFLCRWPFKPEVEPAVQQEMERVRADIVPAASEGELAGIDVRQLTGSLDDLYERLTVEGPPLAAR